MLSQSLLIFKNQPKFWELSNSCIFYSTIFTFECLVETVYRTSHLTSHLGVQPIKQGQGVICVQRGPANKYCGGWCEVVYVSAQRLWDRQTVCQGPKHSGQGLSSLWMCPFSQDSALSNPSTFQISAAVLNLELPRSCLEASGFACMLANTQICYFHVQSARLLLSSIAFEIYVEGQSNHHGFKSPSYKVYVTPIWPPYLSNEWTLNLTSEASNSPFLQITHNWGDGVPILSK